MVVKVNVSSNFRIGVDGYLVAYFEGYPPERISADTGGNSVLELRVKLASFGYASVQVWMVVDGRMDDIVAMTEVVEFYLTSHGEAANYTNNVEVAQCRYGRMLVPTRDEFIGRSLLHYGEWAELEVDLFKELIHSGDTVLDIGGKANLCSMNFRQ